MEEIVDDINLICYYPKDTHTPRGFKVAFIQQLQTSGGCVAERLSLFALSIQPHVSRYNSSPQGQVSCQKQNVF
jgi:hypothetical protein